MSARQPLDQSAAAADWALLLEGLPHAAWVVELAGLRVVAVNGAAASLLGRTVADLTGARADHLATSPEDLAYWAAAEQGPPECLESDTLLCVADGRSLHVCRSIRPLVGTGTGTGTGTGSGSGAGAATPAGHVLVMLRDRSAEQVAETEREGLLAELQATLESTADGILVTDLVGGVRSFNRRFAQIWGVPADLLAQRDDAALQRWMSASVVDPLAYDKRTLALRSAPLLTASERLNLHSGQVLELVTRPLWSGGRALGRVFSYRDLSERIAADLRIETLAATDALTGLPNRRSLVDRLEQAVGQSRQKGPGCALLIVDIDRFRRVNESLGHDVGDQVLLDVAQRIQGCLRQGDMLARVGGDQFAILVTPADAQSAQVTARRVLGVVAQPCNVDGAQFTLTCSIGLALCPSHGQTADDLARHAEAAMRSVKQAGRANYRLHELRAEGDRRSNMSLDHAMRQALVSGRFRLHYQPQVALADGRLVGAEALLRWRDPELGDVSPARFIPVAEDTGFIVAIGDWVLTQAVRQAALWHQRGQAMPIAINVSALQFQQAQFVDRVARVLAVSGMPPHLLELELTESILVHDAADALQRLHALAALGLRLSIDDFGTGYSSLAYLKRFPIHKLKIDRSFVQGLPGDESDAGIVCAILQMARALGKKVIAEGVETEAQRQFLLEAGCDEFQGFLYAPALDSLSFEQRMADALAHQAPKRMTLVRS